MDGLQWKIHENPIKMDDLGDFGGTPISGNLHIQEAHRTDHIHTHFVVANFQSISKQFSKEGLIDTKISN
jgi:hypothetical protein